MACIGGIGQTLAASNERKRDRYREDENVSGCFMFRTLCAITICSLLSTDSEHIVPALDMPCQSPRNGPK